MKRIILIILLSVYSFAANAQLNIDVAWKLNNFPINSAFEVITPQRAVPGILNRNEITYLATGYQRMNLNGTFKNCGYVVHFSERGEILNQWDIILPSGLIEWNSKTAYEPTLLCKGAYLTDDNRLIAFSTLLNSGVDPEYKGVDANSQTNPADNFYLRNGFFVHQMRYEKNNDGDDRVINFIQHRGELIGEVKEYTNGRYLVTGYDFASNNESTPSQVQQPSSFALLLRCYDSDLNLLYDLRNTLVLTSLYTANINGTIPYTPVQVLGSRFENIDYIPTANIINFSLVSEWGNITFSSLNLNTLVYSYSPTIFRLPAWGVSCIGEPPVPSSPFYSGDTGNPGHPYGPTSMWSKLNDQSWVSMGRMGTWYEGTSTSSMLGVSYGLYSLHFDNNANIAACTTIQSNSTPLSYNPLQMYYMPGSINPIGSGYQMQNHFYSYYNYDPATNNITIDNNPLELGFAFKNASAIDGIFAAGGNIPTSNYKAGIVKYSNCMRFKITDQETNTSLENTNLSYSGPNSNITVTRSLPIQGVEGNLSDLTYKVVATLIDGSVNGQTAIGSVLYDSGDLVAESLTKLGDINQSFTYNTPFRIKYLITMTDRYTLSGQAQSCQRSYQFEVRSLPQTNVVAVPSLETANGVSHIKTTIRNAGSAPCIAPYTISIFADGATTASEIYTYNNNIAIGEVVDLDIPLTTTSTNLKLQYNTTNAEIDNTVKDSLFDVITAQ